MNVAIAGAHGQIGLRLTRLLCERGDAVVGLIRNPDHGAELQRLGARPAVCDLEHAALDDVVTAIDGCDGVVFAAGAGAGSGAQRKQSMDRDGAIKLLTATARAGIPRFVIVSSVGADNPPADDDVFSVYLRAKADADRAVVASDRDWTILRPGRLTDDPGTGRIRLDTTPFRGDVTRDDVAAVIVAVLGEPRSIATILYVNGGDDPIADALASAVTRTAAAS